MKKFRKKALSFLLAVVLFAGMLPAITIAADAAEVPQSAVDDFVRVAKAAEGKTHTALGLPTTGWCGYFVEYCLENSQIGNLLGELTGAYAQDPVVYALKKGSGTFSVLATGTPVKAYKDTYYNKLVNWTGSSNNIIKVDSFQPEPGDMVLFNWNASTNTNPSHIGIMISENSLIHGNFGSSKVRETSLSIIGVDSNGDGTYDAPIRNYVIGYFRFGGSNSQTVDLDPTYLTLPVGASFDFSKGQATVTSADWGDLSWKSSNSGVASVSAGVVTGKAVGEATVTVSTASGSSDSVTFNIVKPSYHCAEKWTIVSEKVGPFADQNLNAARSARHSTGNYVVWKDAPVYILARYTDSDGRLWGFGGGYSSYLDQNIWGWYDLVDGKLGSEQYDYNYMPATSTVNVQKKGDGVATVSWSAANQATYYNLYQDDVLIKSNLQATSADVTMEIGTTATFAVEAVNGNFAYHNIFPCSTKSSSVSFTMPGHALLDADNFKSRMVLENELDLQIAVPRDSLSDWTGVYAKVTKEVENGEPVVRIIPAEKWSTGSMRIFSAIGVAAKEMTDTIYVQLFDAKDRPISTVKTETVKDYALRAFALSSATTEKKAMYIDMLYYGAACQENFDYNTDKLANAGLTAEQRAYVTESVAYENTMTKTSKVLGTRVILESRILLQVAVKGIDKNHYATFSYSSHVDGSLQEGRIEGSEFEFSGTTATIMLTHQAVADGRNPITVRVYNAEGVEVASVTDSMESYVARVTKNNASPMYESILKFSDSAYAALH